MDISKDWLVGFIEGEGNFNIALSKNHKSASWSYPFEYYPILQFRIFLTEEDLPVLEKIKNNLGLGQIYKKNNQYLRNKGVNSKDECYWVISSLKDLIKFKEFLSSTEFHSKKKRDKDIFFKVLELKSSKKHLTEEGYKEILRIIAPLNGGNRDKFKRKSV